MLGSHPPEQAAARLRAWLGEQIALGDNTATPVDTLAERLGLIVESFNAALHPATLGFLEPGEDVIFLRAGLPESVRRFTLAHELGHVALHRRSGLAAEICQTSQTSQQVSALGDDAAGEDVCADADLGVTDNEDETLRPGQAYSARAQREGEANTFAAALLLPGMATRAAYQALCAAGEERPALALARRFGVSEEMALRRLATLLTEREAATPAPSEATDETLEAIDASAAQAPQPLDSDQRRAARVQAPALVVAGPGSGKTSALLARVAYLVNERGVAPERLLALTFSRKAADELRERLTRLLGEGVATPSISTIHAFCGETLRRYGPLVGLRADYRLMTEIEGYFLLRQVVSRAPLTRFTPLSAPTMYFRDLLGAISRAKDDLVTPEQYRAAAERMAEAAKTSAERAAAASVLQVAALYAAYQAALDAQGDADYADLIARVCQLLREQPEAAAELRGRYEHVLVDEYQDINYAMSALLRELVGPRGPLWAVGDADQAIYRFRGASPTQLLRFDRDYQGARTLKLGRNYRSRPAILDAANTFAKDYLPGVERITLTPTRPADTTPAAVVTLATAPDEEAELDGLAQAMLAQVAAGVPLRAQAVLLRTRAYVKRVCAGLHARGVAAQLAEPLLDQPLIKTLLATISLTVDAQGIGLLRAGALLDHAFGDDDARTLLRIAQQQRIAPLDAIQTPHAQAALSAEALAALKRLARIIAELRAAPSVATGLSRYVFSLTALGSRLLDPAVADVATDANDARSQASQVARLLAICHAFDDQRAASAASAASAPPSEGHAEEASAETKQAEETAPQADWPGLLDYIAALRELGLDASAIASGSDEDAALVMTAHAAKGLEFPAVYLPQLGKGRFPGQARHDLIAPPPGLLHESDDDDNPLLEEANLFYVAITRARDTLTLSYAERYGKRACAPSPFITSLELGMGKALARQRWENAAPALHSAQGVVASDGAGGAVVQPSLVSGGEPLSVTLSQLEAYQRCPQQYAYQYVYGLWPATAPLVSLRSALLETSAELRQRFADAASAADPAETADAANAANDTHAPPTLAEAQTLFIARWEAARAAAQAENETAGASGAARDETLTAIYQRHGERVIERLWRALQQGEPPPALADDLSDAAETSDDAASIDSTDALSAGAGSAASVTLAGAIISGGLDHVEGARGAGGGNSAATARGGRRVARYVSSSLDATATLRDLFYILAAEQMRAQGQPVTPVRVSLTSGAVKPLRPRAQTIARLQDEASAALAGLARASYPPRPEPRTCATCPFALVCPA